MLRLRYPTIHLELSDLPSGLWPIKLPDNDEPVLFVKVPKEFTLTAVERRYLRIYFFQIRLEGLIFIAVFTAFFDDLEEPLCVRTLLFDDQPSSTLLAILLQPKFDIYFFDENNRELASFKAEITDPAGLRERIRNLGLSKSSRTLMAQAYDLAVKRFSHRSPEDDAQAFHVLLADEIFPSDVFTIDLDGGLGGYIGSNPVAYHSLVQTEPGRFQEPSILNLLQRLFQNNQLFMNPMRADKPDKEFADALIVTSTHVVIIQAKDSPNTGDMVGRSIARKRATSRKQLTSGVGQLEGALRYTNKDAAFDVMVQNKLYKPPILDKTRIGVVVVRELFPDESNFHSKIVRETSESTGCCTVVLDFHALSVLIFHSGIQETFLALLEALSAEATAGHYPEMTQFILTCYATGQLPEGKQPPTAEDR